MIRSLPYTKNLLLTRLQKYYLSCFLILMYHYWTFKSWYLVRSFIYKLVKNYFCTQICRIRPEQLCQGICSYISKNIERLKNTLRKRKEAQSWFKISFELFMFFWCRVTHLLTHWLNSNVVTLFFNFSRCTVWQKSWKLLLDLLVCETCRNEIPRWPMRSHQFYMAPLVPDKKHLFDQEKKFSNWPKQSSLSSGTNIACWWWWLPIALIFW